MTTDVTNRGFVCKTDLSNNYGDWLLYTASADPSFYINPGDETIGSGAKILNTIISNVWTTLAGTYDGVNIKIYQDGILGDTEPLVQAIPNSAWPVIIGGYYSLSYLLPGNIDYVMIYNRALSASEIALLYNKPFCGFRWTNIIQLASYIAGEPPSGIPIFRRRRAG